MGNICGFFSSRSLKMREIYISFGQLVLLSFYIFEGSVSTFQFLSDKIHNYVKIVEWLFLYQFTSYLQLLSFRLYL